MPPAPPRTTTTPKSFTICVLLGNPIYTFTSWFPHLQNGIETARPHRIFVRIKCKTCVQKTTNEQTAKCLLCNDSTNVTSFLSYTRVLHMYGSILFLKLFSKQLAQSDPPQDTGDHSISSKKESITLDSVTSSGLTSW